MNEYSGRYPWGDKDSAIWLSINEKLGNLGFNDKELAYLSGLYDVRTLHVLKGIAKREKQQKEEAAKKPKFKVGDIVFVKSPFNLYADPMFIVRKITSIDKCFPAYGVDIAYLTYRVEDDDDLGLYYSEGSLETFEDVVRRMSDVLAACSDDNTNCNDCPYEKIIQKHKLDFGVKIDCGVLARRDRRAITYYLEHCGRKD